MLTPRTHSNTSTKENRKELRNNATIQERILWSKLKGKNLGYKFQRQHSIGKYIADFYCAEKRLIIEIDGIQHNDIEDKKYDTERTRYFESLGYSVLRF
ncbi:MAG: endonuclease domain-containing protein [Patescibacteria group bacterium]